MNRVLILLFLLVFASSMTARAQTRDFFISGKVIDSATRTPLAQVSIIEMAGMGGTLTDDQGNFTIDITENSKLKFSRLGYKDLTLAARLFGGDEHITIKIAELPIAIPEVNVEAKKEEKHDSINNRLQNKEIFDAKREKAVTVGVGTRVGIGISPSRIYDNYFNPRLKRLRRYRKVLEKSEQLTYISNRFTPKLVTSITGLHGQQLVHFMTVNRPEFDWLHANSDYELYEFIERHYKAYVAGGN